MAKAPAENHFCNLLRLNDGGLGTMTPDVAYCVGFSDAGMT